MTKWDDAFKQERFGRSRRTVRGRCGEGDGARHISQSGGHRKKLCRDTTDEGTGY